MEFHIIEKYEDFCALENDWEDLLGRIESPQIFYKFRWAKNYLEYYTPEWKNSLCVVAGYDNQKLIALFPFVLEKGVIRFITSQTTDYNMVYVDNTHNRFSLIRKGIECLFENKKIDSFSLNCFPTSSVLYLLEEVLREKDYSAFIEESVMTPTIRVNEVGSEKFNKERMRGIRRKEHKLEREHNVQVICENELSEEVLSFLVDHQTKKFESSKLKYVNTQEFYRHLCKDLASQVYINSLYMDNILVASFFCFVDSKVYCYITSYDEKYSNESVGMILLKKIIEENVGVKEFDFLRGNEEYKFYYCDEAGMNFTLLAFKKGTSYTIMQRAMNALKNNHFVRKIMGR